MPNTLIISYVCIFFSSGIFHSIYWGLGGFIGIVIGGGLIRVAGPTTAFRLFTMLAVVFIALFTMGLRYVNLRDRNYYSVLLSTFNNCVDSTNTEQKCDNSTNNTSQENDAKVQSPSSASFSLEFLGNSWDERDTFPLERFRKKPSKPRQKLITRDSFPRTDFC